MAVELRERETLPTDVETIVEEISTTPAVIPDVGLFSSVLYDESPDFLDPIDTLEAVDRIDLGNPIFKVSQLYPREEELETAKKLHWDSIKTYDPLRVSVAITGIKNSLRRLDEFTYHSLVRTVQKICIKEEILSHQETYARSQDKTEFVPFNLPPIDKNPS